MMSKAFNFKKLPKPTSSLMEFSLSISFFCTSKALTTGPKTETSLNSSLSNSLRMYMYIIPNTIVASTCMYIGM